MPNRARQKITKRTVDALSGGAHEGVHWDRELPGFGVRVYRTGRKTYVAQSRGPNGSRRVTLGGHGAITAHLARKLAVGAIGRIKAGEEPMPDTSEAGKARTVADLAQRYLREHVAVQCKPASLASYRQQLNRHILPALGTMPVAAVGREHVAALHFALRATPGTANEVRKVLSKMFSLAETWRLRPPGRNPCRSVRKYKMQRRERFLSREEYRRVGRVLREAEENGTIRPAAVAAIRLLMLTGCRSNEIATLRWDDVDRTAGHIRLSDSKTGARMVPLTRAALQVLDGIERTAGNPWVFVGRKRGAHVGKLYDYWDRLRGDLSDVRVHDLRHSYASRALALGESLPTIGKLLGHKKVQTTARYAHLARDTEKASAARVAGSIEDDVGLQVARGEHAVA